METTFVRGFSNTYTASKNLEEVKDLQFIEGGELERLWKQARRERLKLQEEMIWGEFVKDQDILKAIDQEDKYQFIETVPEDCLKELINNEVEKNKTEEGHAAGDSASFISSEEDGDDGEVFNIFDEDKDEISPDEELFEEVEEPCTVRERIEVGATASCACGPSEALTEATEKNSDTNMATMIESSIYCAKVKNLRAKIKEALLAIIPSLESINLSRMEPSGLRKLRARAAEYAARFQRIHLYQLTSHIHDLERHNAQALPFAKHTHFQSQMMRVVALHSHSLHAIQVFHRSFAQTACLNECAEQLRALCGTLREGVAACCAVPVPSDFGAAKELYNDDIVSVCSHVEQCAGEYVARVADVVRAALDYNNRNTKRKDREKNRLKRKSIASWSRIATKNTNSNSGMSDPRLSMYSLDVQSATRPQRPARPLRIDGKDSILRKEISKKDKLATPRSLRKTPRSRLPLMRAPSGRKRGEAAAAKLMDHELHTMVEAVDVTGSMMSHDDSPRRSKLTSPPAPSAGGVGAVHVSSRSPYMCTGAGARSPPPAGAPPRTPRSSRLSHRSDMSSKPSASGAGAGAGAVLEPGAGRTPRRGSLSDRERGKMENVGAATPNYDVTTILRQLCGGDASGSRGEQVSGAKNAQLLSINNSFSPRQPTTPQLLRILEETIQKKAPKPMQPRRADADRLRLAFNTPQRVADHLFQYRTKFVQHMLASTMYANSAVGRPWEVIGRVADDMISDILVECAWEMELVPMVSQLYLAETKPKPKGH